MSEIKGLGFIPSPEDRRDILMSTILPVFSAPRKVDYTEQMTAVRDQERKELVLDLLVQLD